MSEKFIFQRLNNQNYQTWKMRMEMLLKREELWSAIQDAKPAEVTAAWIKDDQKCLATIVLYIDDSQLNLIKNAAEARVAWNQLKTYHEKATMTSRVSLLKRICSLNMVDGTDMEKHLLELEELFDRLACAGQQLEDSLKIAMIHRSLPDSYSGLVTALESRPEADLTIDFVKQKVLDEHQRRVERSVDFGEKALKMQARGQQKRVCYHCQKPGHFRRNCPILQQERSNVVKKEEASVNQVAEAEVPICFAIGNNRSQGSWYVDSGCSTHMTNDKSFFDQLNENVSVDVVLADGSVTQSTGVGEGSVRCIGGDGKERSIVVKEVLFIPSLESGLLSVRKLTQKGLKVEFDESRCNVVSSTGKVVAVAELRGNLYMLNVTEESTVNKEAQVQQNCLFVRHAPGLDTVKNETAELQNDTWFQEEPPITGFPDERVFEEESGDCNEEFHDCEDEDLCDYRLPKEDRRYGAVCGSILPKLLKFLLVVLRFVTGSRHPGLCLKDVAPAKK